MCYELKHGIIYLYTVCTEYSMYAEYISGILSLSAKVFFLVQYLGCSRG